MKKVKQKSVLVNVSCGFKHGNDELNTLLDNGWLIDSITPLIPCDTGKADSSWTSCLVIIRREEE